MARVKDDILNSLPSSPNYSPSRGPFGAASTLSTPEDEPDGHVTLRDRPRSLLDGASYRIQALNNEQTQLARIHNCALGIFPYYPCPQGVPYNSFEGVGDGRCQDCPSSLRSLNHIGLPGQDIPASSFPRAIEETQREANVVSLVQTPPRLIAMADIDFSESFDWLFSLPDFNIPEDLSPLSDATSLLRTPEDELHDFNWPPNDIAIQDPTSHLLDDTSLLLQQASDEGLKRDQRNETQEIVGTVSPYDMLLRHPSTLDAGSGSQDAGLTAPRRISISPEPLVSPPALKKRKGKSKMVPCGAIPSNVTSSVRKSEPRYKEGVHYSVNSQPPVDTVEQCKWGGNCRHSFKMEQGQWTGHLQSMHPNDMKTPEPHRLSPHPMQMLPIMP